MWPQNGGFRHPSHNQKENDAHWNRLQYAFNAFHKPSLCLESNAFVITVYDFFEAIHFVPKSSNIDKAIGNLIFISNNTFETDREERIERKHQMDELKQLLYMKS